MKYKLTVIAFFMCNLLHAQSRTPEKYQEALEGYRQLAESQPKMDGGKEEHEGPDALLNRWAWYWKQHTDENGYMVPPAKTLEEWQKYTAVKANRGGARTTATANWIFQGPHAQYTSQGRVNVAAF